MANKRTIIVTRNAVTRDATGETDPEEKEEDAVELESELVAHYPINQAKYKTQ